MSSLSRIHHLVPHRLQPCIDFLIRLEFLNLDASDIDLLAVVASVIVANVIVARPWAGARIVVKT